MQGNLDAILDNITSIDNQPETIFHFFFPNGEDIFTLLTVDMGEIFAEKYQNDGYSVRGSREDIFFEINDVAQDDFEPDELER